MPSSLQSNQISGEQLADNPKLLSCVLLHECLNTNEETWNQHNPTGKQQSTHGNSEIQRQCMKITHQYKAQCGIYCCGCLIEQPLITCL